MARHFPITIKLVSPFHVILPQTNIRPTKRFASIHKLMHIKRFPRSPPYLTCLNYRDNHSSLNTSSILSIFLYQYWIKACSLKSWGSLVREFVELAWISCQRPGVAFWARKLENGRDPAPRQSTIPFPSFWLLLNVTVVFLFVFVGKPFLTSLNGLKWLPMR